MSLGVRPDQVLNPEQGPCALFSSFEKQENNEFLKEEQIINPWRSFDTVPDTQKAQNGSKRLFSKEEIKLGARQSLRVGYATYSYLAFGRSLQLCTLVSSSLKWE